MTSYLDRVNWRQVLNVGLITGLVALFIALVGLIEAFGERFVIFGVISMGQSWLLIMGLVFGFIARRRLVRLLLL